MITIEQNLPAFAFAGNPLLMKLISNNIISTAGVNAEMQLAISAVDTVAGHDFTLTFGTTVLNFMSATTPDDSGQQYEKASGTDTTITWAAKIHAALISNYYLATNYDIDLYTDETPVLIIFTAKVSGSAYSLTFTNHNAAGISEELGTTDGVDPVYRENFIVIATLWDGVTKIAEDNKPVDTDGRVTFNFSEYLKSLLETDDPRFTWPEVPGTNTHEFTNHVQEYQVSLAEKYDGVARKIVYDTVRHAIGGGLSRETLVSFNNASDIFWENLDNIKRWLTWAPNLQEMGADVPQKLFYVFQGESGNHQYKLICTVIYDDGSLIVKECSAYINITDWNVVECVCGYNQLELGNLDPTHTVKRWYMTLISETTYQITESRGFTFDPDVYETQRVFMFLNSFNAYDIVRFTGKGELSPEYSRVSGTRVEDDDYTWLNAPVKLFSSVETQAMKANSGWIPLASKKHLRDFLLSREAYEIIDDKLYPIIITAKKAQSLTSDEITLHSLDIEYERAYNDMYWSDMEIEAEAVVIPDREYSDDYNPIEYS